VADFYRRPESLLQLTLARPDPHSTVTAGRTSKMVSNVTSKRQKATAAALVVGLSFAAGLNVVQQHRGHEPLSTSTAAFSNRSLVKFPTDLRYRTAPCPAYPRLGYACWIPEQRTVYYGGKPDYTTYLHESCHAWQSDHAGDPASKQELKAILNYNPRTRFDWLPGEATDGKVTRIPPVEAFADACSQCAMGKRVSDLGYGRGLSLQRWKGLCRFIAARA
jgi:hypothetical protein